MSQLDLADEANAAGLRTNHPTVGRYLHYLADALLIREFRRFPIARAKTARVPVKTTLTDLGVRNAIFRGAPSLWESPPDVVGTLVETLVQAPIRDADLAVHFYRERVDPTDRRSPFREVDFVAERTDGTVLPVEVNFRHKIDDADLQGLRAFIDRYSCPWGADGHAGYARHARERSPARAAQGLPARVLTAVHQVNRRRARRPSRGAREADRTVIMASSEAEMRNHDALFARHVSKLKETDPELTSGLRTGARGPLTSPRSSTRTASPTAWRSRSAGAPTIPASACH